MLRFIGPCLGASPSRATVPLRHRKVVSSRMVLAFLAGAVVAAVPLARAVDPPPPTLQQCAALLPQGKAYNFHVAGTIDRTGNVPEVRGSMQVDDGTTVDRTAEVDSRGFGACVARMFGE